MFGSFLEKKENLIGLDIGSHTVKIIQVNVKDAKLRLLSCGVIPVPGDAFAEGRIKKPELVAQSVQQLTGHLKIKGRSVATSISGYEVMIKKIDLPTMTKEELNNRMKSELGQYIPYNIEEVYVDYEVLNLASARPNHMDVLLVAAKKESVSDSINIVRLSGLDALVVDVDFFALSNAFESTYGFGADENIALLDIGANKAIINIINRGVPVFTRGISIGGNQLTERIQDQFRISLEEAEKVKMGSMPGNLPREEVEEIFITTVRDWVSECRRAIDFYYGNYPESRISKVFLSGGSCRIPGLDRVFRDRLDIDVEIFNPLSRIEVDSGAFDPAYIDFVGPQMAISFGLALRRTIEK